MFQAYDKMPPWILEPATPSYMAGNLGAIVKDFEVSIVKIQRESVDIPSL